MAAARLFSASVDLIGDAQLLLTAPFYPSADPLDERPTYQIPSDGLLDGKRRLIQADPTVVASLRGVSAYGNPTLDQLTQFAGSERFNAELARTVENVVDLSVRLTVNGVLFPDGYGTAAVLIEVAGGWDKPHRERLIDGFGPEGRDAVAERLLAVLRPALAEMADRCCPKAPCETIVPYYNLTYVAQTSEARPGRGTLPDELRLLIYPRSPAPITSDSTWSDEFFYAGYAYSILVGRNPRNTLEQIGHLLLYLGVLYARMDRSAGAADQLIRSATLEKEQDREWLIGLERRLRADYQALVRPTFTYDYHVLKLRDSLLYAWETEKMRERADTLMQMARQAVERKFAEDQARRVTRVKLVVTILTALSLVSSIDAAVDLWTRLVH